MPKHLASHIVEQHDPKKTLTPSPAGPSTSLKEAEISSLAISSTTAMLLAKRGPPDINPKPPISLTKAPVQKTTCNWCPLEVPIKYKQLHMSQYHREAMMQFMPPRPMLQPPTIKPGPCNIRPGPPTIKPVPATNKQGPPTIKPGPPTVKLGSLNTKHASSQATPTTQELRKPAHQPASPPASSPASSPAIKACASPPAVTSPSAGPAFAAGPSSSPSPLMESCLICDKRSVGKTTFVF